MYILNVCDQTLNQYHEQKSLGSHDDEHIIVQYLFSILLAVCRGWTWNQKFVTWVYDQSLPLLVQSESS